MKKEEWEVLHRYLDGGISSEELATLEALLRSNAEARSTLRSLATIDAKWQQMEPSETVVRLESLRNRSERRSWKSAAALIALGLFAGCLGTGVAWAYAKADAVSSTRLPISLFDGGFETEAKSAVTGYPTRPRIWSGDQVEVVKSGHQGVSSFEGQRMMRFVQTWGDEPERRGARSNQWQIVDLSGLEPGADKLLATLKARFNRIDAGPDTDTVFRIEVQAFSGDPASAEAQYDLDTQISGAELKKSTDGNPQTWEELEVTTSVPPETDFLLIGFYAHEDVVDDPPTAPEFAGHYVDGVELELIRIKP
ncbi:MAG: hypothetical protein AAF357_03745 [Verrucomicrobiota bacterium]